MSEREQINKIRKEFGSFEIEANELIFGDEIGSGSFGHVYRGKCRGKEVALKKLRGQNLTPEQLEELRKEVEIMSMLYHPNIVLFMGACFEKGHMAMVTELLPEGSVSELLRSKPNITLFQKLLMARDCCLGMNWLHTRNPTILHRDLKPANLLVDKDWNVKVCDFGLSTAVERGRKWEDEDDIPGTPLWMAPEVMLGKKIDGKADVYSFGLTLWEFFSIKEPYSQFSNFNDFRKAICFKGVRPPMPESVPKPVAALIVRCWDDSPSVRPTFVELLPIMDSLIVECMINDARGQEFWRSSFTRSGSVDFEIGWHAFLKHFLAFLALPERMEKDAGTQCMQTLLAEKTTRPGGSEDVIRIEKFGHFLDWFGPMPAGAAAASANENLINSPINRIFTLASFTPKEKEKSPSRVFHGDITSQEAESLLSNQEKGTWLVRVSPKDPLQPFTISKVTREGAVAHQRVYWDPKHKRYHMEIFGKDGSKQVHSTDASLVDFLRKLKKDLYLKTPCPGSKYNQIFSHATLVGYLS